MIDTVKTDRWRYLGGSDIPVLMGLSKFKTRDELVEQYAKKDIENVDNEYVHYGNFMEDAIRFEFNKTMNYLAIPACVVNEDKKIRCNTDGYDRNNNIIIEIKTNNGKHKNTIDYELQMQLYMYAFNVEKGYLIEYPRPKDFFKGFSEEHYKEEKFYDLSFDKTKLKIKEIKRNNLMIEHILREIDVFWERVKKMETIIGQNIELLKIEDESERALIIQESQQLDVIEKAIVLQELELKKMQDKQKTIKEKLIGAMKKYDVKSFNTDNFKITLVETTTRISFDSTRFKEEHPELYEDYKKISTVKDSLRITKLRKELED